MGTPVDNPIEVALDALDNVLLIHELHLWPQDTRAIVDAMIKLKAMQADGYK
jgi:hypothetical protein